MDENQSPPWTVERDPSGTRIRLRVSGHLDETVGTQAAQEFLRLGRAGPFEFIANLEGMTGYDRRVREAFQAAFLELKDHLYVIHFVGLGPIFRMAAATVCLAAGKKAEFHSDEQSIPATAARSA